MKISGPQLKPLGELLLAMNDRGIIPESIDRNFNKKIVVLTNEGSRGKEYTITESGIRKVEAY